MNINLKFEKKPVLFLAALIIGLALIGLVIAQYTQDPPNPGHGGNTVWISIDGVEKTLQAAIDDRSLSNGAPGNIVGGGHLSFVGQQGLDAGDCSCYSWGDASCVCGGGEIAATPDWDGPNCRRMDICNPCAFSCPAGTTARISSSAENEHGDDCDYSRDSSYGYICVQD
ncbi:MAG: hypothetical protein ABID38_05230 [Candidatus Diapherotrites archaeon]